METTASKQGDVRIEWTEHGPANGPVTILLHGFPELGFGWRKQVPALAEAGQRVIVPDQRGYNDSEKPLRIEDYHLDLLAADVVALADRVGAETFRLVGHDWGGLVAWWVASQYPERVERLVILNAPHPVVVWSYMKKNPSQALKSSYIAFFQLPYLPEKILSSKGFTSLARTLKGTSRKGTFSNDELARYFEAWSKPGALTSMLNWYRALRYFSAKGRNARVLAPTLILWGERDGFLERGLAEKSAKLCDDVMIEWFPRATHWLHLEESDAVNAKIIEFFGQ